MLPSVVESWELEVWLRTEDGFGDTASGFLLCSVKPEGVVFVFLSMESIALNDIYILLKSYLTLGTCLGKFFPKGFFMRERDMNAIY